MKKPNIVFVLTDDQGYGDLACTGNPWVKTPNIDAFYDESLRVTDYHVGPTCAPTRAGIMTGHYANSTGVWHTIGGRSLLREKEVTLATALSNNGYSTGIFGKWHLGDNYPYRAMDRGFQRSIVHGGGGISQAPDFWGNDYFDDTYYVDGEPQKFSGYCTDVFFTEAMKYIEEKKDEPFFCYITTNAPHGPLNVPKEYYEMYKDVEDVPDKRARFYGMITNIDDNFGKLKAHLEKLGILDNTILIFMTDNGTAGGATFNNGFVVEGYNAGLRGSKVSAYDGGHRVPFFIKCPEKNIGGGKDMSQLCANVDLMPTFLELCGIENSQGLEFDGTSIAAQFVNPEEKIKDRVLVTDSQRLTNPVKWKDSSVMWNKYRLIYGKELYNTENDRGQEHDIASENPEIVAKLRDAYEHWWDHVTDGYEKEVPIYLIEDEIYLSSHDLRGDVQDCIHNQEQIRKGTVAKSYWEVYIPETGKYQFDVRRWPKSHERALVEGIDPENNDVEWQKDGIEPTAITSYCGGEALDIVKTQLVINDVVYENPVNSEEVGSKFVVDLEKGPAHLYTLLIDKDNVERSAYFVYAKKI